MFQAFCYGWKKIQHVGEAGFRIRSKNSHANFLAADGSHVNLAVGPPMNFDVIGPRRCLKVASEAVAKTLLARGSKLRPLANVRVLPISADNPSSAYRAPLQGNFPLLFGFFAVVPIQANDTPSPVHLHAQSRGALSKSCVESGASNPPAPFIGKIRLCREISLDESNTSERKTLSGRDCDTKFAKSGHAVRHETFAACLVDGRRRAVRDGNTKALLTRSDGSRKSGRATADNKNVYFEGSCL